MPEEHELFPDEFMNDMLLNPDLYGMNDGLNNVRYEKDDEEEDDDDEYDDEEDDDDEDDG